MCMRWYFFSFIVHSTFPIDLNFIYHVDNQGQLHRYVIACWAVPARGVKVFVPVILKEEGMKGKEETGMTHGDPAAATAPGRSVNRRRVHPLRTYTRVRAWENNQLIRRLFIIFSSHHGSRLCNGKNGRLISSRSCIDNYSIGIVDDSTSGCRSEISLYSRDSLFSSLFFLH